MFERIYGEEEDHFFKFEEFLILDDSELEGPESYESEWTKILKDEYFVLLNEASLQMISAILQYINQHEKANFLALRKKDTPLESIQDIDKAGIVSELLKRIVLQEMEHLEKISERIYLLGGKRVYTPDPLPRFGDTADDFLKLDHKAEDEAIVLYEEIIAEALKRGDTTTRRIFEDIVIEEDEHY